MRFVDDNNTLTVDGEQDKKKMKKSRKDERDRARENNKRTKMSMKKLHILSS